MNELIFIVTLLIISGSIIIMHHYLDKLGFKILLVIMTILSFIMSFKIGNYHGIPINVNIIPYMSIFTIFYILQEKYNKKEVKESLQVLVKTSLFTIITFILFILYIQSINDSITINPNNIKDIFSNIIYLIIIPLSIIGSLKTYNYMKTINDNIYINIIIVTILIGLIESIIISLVTNDINYTIHIALANYLLKIITMIFNIIIIKIFKNKKKVLS